MADLPDDVLSIIFIGLLAKQLAQMRCVCKSWNALLSGSSFIKSHLHHSIHNNDKILLFFQKGFFLEDKPGPLTARPSHSPHLVHTNFKKLKLPIYNPQQKRLAGHVLGSENGLICFTYSSYENGFFIHIWNPSLSALLTLPPSSLSPSSCFLAFGFDPKNDDYKVVRLLSSSHRKPKQTPGEVYSMRKGSWESISDTVPSHIKNFMDRNETCVNGHLHWLCVIDVERKPEPQTIVAFDLGAMTFSEIPLPDSIRPRHVNELGVLGGKLCVMSSVEDGECRVWVMDESSSWVKHHAFSQFTNRLSPLGFTSQNEFLFQVGSSCRFALYDPITSKTKSFKIKLTQQQLFSRFKIIEYVDSLIWITPANRLQI